MCLKQKVDQRRPRIHGSLPGPFVSGSEAVKIAVSFGEAGAVIYLGLGSGPMSLSLVDISLSQSLLPPWFPKGNPRGKGQRQRRHIAESDTDFKTLGMHAAEGTMPTVHGLYMYMEQTASGPEQTSFSEAPPCRSPHWPSHCPTVLKHASLSLGFYFSSVHGVCGAGREGGNEN